MAKNRLLDILLDSSLIITACGSMVIAMDHYNKTQIKEYQEKINNICNFVGFANPRDVESYSQLDINNDSNLDIRLVLKDGCKLEYLSK